jgi:hypothetical protein
MVCYLRGSGNYAEEEIAEKAGFGSVAAMNTQLGNWGLSGLLSEKADESGHQRKQRTAKSGAQGVGVELPRPAAAASLFEEAVDALHRIIEDLEGYRLIHKGGRFINTYVDIDSSTYFPRSSFTPEEWKALCETHGQDVNSRGFMLFGTRLKDPSGGGKYPPRPLVILIALYALLERDMQSLLKALHPEPSAANTERITGLLYKTKAPDSRDGLIRTAEQLAELVCGGDGGRGAPAGDLSPREQNVACSITEYREQGRSNEWICEHYAPLGFSENRVLELGRLGLSWPED